MLDSLSLQLCDIQGRLFALACEQGCASVPFVEAFMRGKTAEALDRPYDRAQWMGEEYLFEEVDEAAGGLPRTDGILAEDVMYWMGYTYRYWHFYTGESSCDMYAVADVHVMARVYPGFHTLDVEVAIDRLREMAAEGSDEGSGSAEA